MHRIDAVDTLESPANDDPAIAAADALLARVGVLRLAGLLLASASGDDVRELDEIDHEYAMRRVAGRLELAAQFL